MMSRNKRLQRVERELFQTLCEFLQHEVHTPLPCFASITAVEVSPDLRHAEVFFRLVGEENDVNASKKLLDIERPNFQKHIAQTLKMKFCPVLRFQYGVAPAVSEIDQLLEQMQRGRRFGE